MELEFHVTQTGWVIGFAHPLQLGFSHYNTGFLDAPECIASGSHQRVEDWSKDGLTCRATIWPTCAYYARGGFLS